MDVKIESEGAVTCGCEEEEDEGFLRNCSHHPTHRKEGKIDLQQKVDHCERFSMAEARRPVLELYQQGGTVSLESTLSGQSLFYGSESCTQVTKPSRLETGRPGYTCQEEPKEAVSEVCTATPPTGEINCSNLRVSRAHGEQEQSPSKHCVPPRASSGPHNQTETYKPSHHRETVLNATNDTPQADRTLKNIKPASLPVHRSHSDTLPLVKQAVAPQAPDGETCVLTYHVGDKHVQEVESHSALACKQPMQLQQCNIVTTICQRVNSGKSTVQQPQNRCVCISAPKAAKEGEGVEEKGNLLPKCDQALSYGSYIHQANFEDTFAAYCHPQPIPAPSQLLPRLAGIEPGCNIQREMVPPSVMSHLTLPRLISSVSETGLDAKHLLQCCNVNCSWIRPLPPDAGLQSHKHLSGGECCGSPIGLVRTMTRDIGTMTAHRELRDVGVQTRQTATPHVFPQICLAEERRSETSCSQTPSRKNTDSDGRKKLGGPPRSPVKEVKWDAEGMTWEVYGASVDPEELGLAIQRHLELQIKETANRASKLSRQNTNTSRHSGNTGYQRKRSRMIGSIQTCCSRTTTAVD